MKDIYAPEIDVIGEEHARLDNERTYLTDRIAGELIQYGESDDISMIDVVERIVNFEEMTKEERTALNHWFLSIAQVSEPLKDLFERAIQRVAEDAADKQLRTKP